VPGIDEVNMELLKYGSSKLKKTSNKVIKLYMECRKNT
jgi:hypothetical protein